MVAVAVVAVVAAVAAVVVGASIVAVVVVVAGTATLTTAGIGLAASTVVTVVVVVVAALTGADVVLGVALCDTTRPDGFIDADATDLGSLEYIGRAGVGGSCCNKNDDDVGRSS